MDSCLRRNDERDPRATGRSFYRVKANGCLPPPENSQAAPWIFRLPLKACLPCLTGRQAARQGGVIEGPGAGVRISPGWVV